MTMTPRVGGPSAQQMARLDDPELLALIRQGHTPAREILLVRHAYMAHRLARHLRVADTATVTSRAVTIAVERAHSGSGDEEFRELLFAAVRDLADDVVDSAAPGDHPEVEDDAYRSLPATWREVLWQVDAERLPIPDIAHRLEIEPVDVPALLYRARAGLRDAYLTRDTAAVPVDDLDDCSTTRAALSGLLERTLTMSQQERLHTHLRACPACVSIYLADGIGGVHD